MKVAQMIYQYFLERISAIFDWHVARANLCIMRRLKWLTEKHRPAKSRRKYTTQTTATRQDHYTIKGLDFPFIFG